MAGYNAIVAFFDHPNEVHGIREGRQREGKSEGSGGVGLGLRRSSLLLGCEAVSNQTTQQALALPEKEVIQSHLPVRLPCYDFTPVTSPAFGIPLLTVKVTTSGMASSHSVTDGVYKAREQIHRRSAYISEHFMVSKASSQNARNSKLFGIGSTKDRCTEFSTIERSA
ncbi:hypothetical protein S245_044389 [Arachis hypogaea]